MVVQFSIKHKDDRYKKTDLTAVKSTIFRYNCDDVKISSSVFQRYKFLKDGFVRQTKKRTILLHLTLQIRYIICFTLTTIWIMGENVALKSDEVFPKQYVVFRS